MKYFKCILLSIILAGCSTDNKQNITLSRMDSLETAKSIMGKSFGVPVRPYSTFDFGREKDTKNISVVVSEDLARSKISEVQNALGAGLASFIGTTRWLGDEQQNGVEIVISPISNKLDVLRVSRSDAINYDLDTEALIARLLVLDNSLEINIFHAETDTIEFTYKNKPEDYNALANEIYELCPDTVDQGVGSVEELEKYLRANTVVYLWWD